MDRNERREFIKQAAIEAMGAMLANPELYEMDTNILCSAATDYAVKLSKEVESALNAKDV